MPRLSTCMSYYYTQTVRRILESRGQDMRYAPLIALILLLVSCTQAPTASPTTIISPTAHIIDSTLTMTSSPTAEIPKHTPRPSPTSSDPTPSPVATRSLMSDATLLSEPNSPEVESLAWSPDGRLLYVGTVDGLDVYDSSLGIFFEHTGSGRLRNIAANPDGSEVAISLVNGSVVFISTSTGEALHTTDLYSYWIQSLTYTSQGRLLAAALDGYTVHLFDITSGQIPETLVTVEGYGGGKTLVSPDGSTLAVPDDSNAIIFTDVTSGTSHMSNGRHEVGIFEIAFSPDGRLLATTSSDRTVILWDVSTGAIRHRLEGYPSYLWTVAFSPDGTLVAAAGFGYSIIIWDTASGRPIRELYIGPVWFRALSFSPSGSILASGDADGNVFLWDISSE